jgi:hypothetical protein
MTLELDLIYLVFTISLDKIWSTNLLLIATNQEVLLFKLLILWGGATNRDVLLTEACYCSQLYGMWY